MNKATHADLRFALPGDLADWLDAYAERHSLRGRKEALCRLIREERLREEDRKRKRAERARPDMSKASPATLRRDARPSRWQEGGK